MKVRSDKYLSTRNIAKDCTMQRAKELAAEEDEETDSVDANIQDGEGNVPSLPNGRPNS